jgi:hypothetical protein
MRVRRRIAEERRLNILDTGLPDGRPVIQF